MAMAELEILDNRFKPYIPGNCWLEKLYTGTRWAEGPVYFPAGDFLLWSDIPNNRMLRFVDGLGTSVFRSPSNFSNGNTLDQYGRLITCEHLGKVTRTEADGTVTVLAEKYEGKRLNSPNDVVVKSDGLKAMCDDFVMPNGIAFSPDETRLYVSDTGASHDDKGPHHIRVFTVTENGSLSGGEVFAEISPGLSDGFRLDTDGNVWTSAGDGVHCISPDGDLLGKILVPEPVANIEFGGPERNRLFICATTSLYSIYTTQNGARKP